MMNDLLKNVGEAQLLCLMNQLLSVFSLSSLSDSLELSFPDDIRLIRASTLVITTSTETHRLTSRGRIAQIASTEKFEGVLER